MEKFLSLIEKEMMKIGIKPTKIIWKDRVRLVFLYGLLFSGISYLMQILVWKKAVSVEELVFEGIFFGLFMGIGFSYITKGVYLEAKFEKQIQPLLAENEQIQIEGFANLCRKHFGDIVRGKLFLTNKTVIFKSHQIGLLKNQISIPYTEIQEVISTRKAIGLNNNIQIITKNKTQFNFVVNERNEWVEQLKARMN